MTIQSNIAGSIYEERTTLSNTDKAVLTAYDLTKIDNIAFRNTTGTGRTVSLYIRDADSNDWEIESALSVGANTTVNYDPKATLGDGEALRAVADASTTIVVRVSRTVIPGR